MRKGMTFKNHFCKPGTSGSNSSPYGLWHLGCQQKRSAPRWWNFLGPKMIGIPSFVIHPTWMWFLVWLFQNCWGKHLPVLQLTRDPSTLRGLSLSKFPSFQKTPSGKKAQQFMDRQVFTSSLAQSFLQIMDHPRCNLAAGCDQIHRDRPENQGHPGHPTWFWLLQSISTYDKCYTVIYIIYYHYIIYIV